MSHQVKLALEATMDAVNCAVIEMDFTTKMGFLEALAHQAKQRMLEAHMARRGQKTTQPLWVSFDPSLGAVTLTVNGENFPYTIGNEEFLTDTHSEERLRLLSTALGSDPDNLESDVAELGEMIELMASQYGADRFPFELKPAA